MARFLSAAIGRRQLLHAGLTTIVLGPLLAACGGAPASPTAPPAKEAPKAAEPTKPAAATAPTPAPAKPAEPTKPAVATKPTAAAAPAAAPKPARQKLRWWSNYGLEDPKNQALQKVMVPKFQDLRKGMDIEIIFVSNTDLVPKFGTARIAGQAPDVFENFAGRGQLAHYGYVYPLQDEVKLWNLASDLIPTMVRINTVGTDLTGFPGLAGTKMYVYNTQAFAEAGLDSNKFPDTWEAFGEAALKLTKRDGSGKITRSGFRMGRIADWELITTHAYQSGGREFDEPLKGKCTVNQPPFSEAFTWFLDLKRKLKVTPLEGEEYPPGTWPVIEGLAAIEYQGPWWVPNMRLRKPDGADKVRVGPPLIRKDGGARVGLANTNSNLSIYKSSDLLQEAIEAVKLLATNDEIQIAFHNAIDDKKEFPQYFFSARKSINEKLPWLKDEPVVNQSAYKQYLDSGDDVGYGHIGYREMAINIWASTVERATFGVVSDKAALDDAARRADGITQRIISAGA